VAVLGDDLLVGGHYEYIEAPTSVAGCADAANPDPNGDCFYAPRLTAVDRASGAVALDDGAP